MKTILHISASPLGRASESDTLSRKIIGLLRRSEPDIMVIDRSLSGGALLPIDEHYAISQGSADDIGSGASMIQSEELIRELEQANFLVIATPMHNFTVPAVLKSWIDYVVRARRTFDVTDRGKVGRLRDRPVFVAIASGGSFSGEQARQPDFLRPYLRAVLAIIGLQDVTFFSVQGTASNRNAVMRSRANADRELKSHFATLGCPE